jgi:hypothetical protein
MSEQKGEKRLDDALREAINTSRPQFDAEAWRRKYAVAYQTLVSRGAGTAVSGGRTVRLMACRLAVAALILVGVAVLLTQRPEREVPSPVVPAPAAALGPARMISMMSLRTAYLKGGQEGLGAQLDQALKHLGPRPNGLSMRDSFEDSEG